MSAQVWYPPAEIAVIGALTVGDDDEVVYEVGGGGGDVGGWVVAGAVDIVDGVVIGANAQAKTRKPNTILIATCASEERIPSPQDLVSRETFGGARCYLDVFAPVTIIRRLLAVRNSEQHALEVTTDLTL